MIQIEVYIDNVFQCIVAHSQDDYDTLEIGDNIKIDDLVYTILSKEDDKLYLG